MRILIVGAGAVGGYFGGRLAEAGRDVTFLVRPRRAQEMQSKGLRIISPHGDLELHPKTVTADALAEPFDVILLSVKSYALAGAMNDFAAAVGPATTIVPVLNGMRHIDLLRARFGQAVVGGVCLVATDIDEEGRIRQLSDVQKLIYGELDGAMTSRLQQLDGTLQGAGFEAAVSSRIMKDLWQKWVQLATLGSITCLLRGNIGSIAAIPGGSPLALAVLAECSAVAAASGYPPGEAFLEQQRVQLTAEGSPLTSSMYRDLKKGSAVEVDTIIGDLLEHGRKHGLTTPLVQAAFVNLSVYQRGLDASLRQ